MKATWGKRCNKLLFMSSKEDKVHINITIIIITTIFIITTLIVAIRVITINDYQELGSVALDAPEGHDNLWAKTRQAFQYVYKHHKVKNNTNLTNYGITATNSR